MEGEVLQLLPARGLDRSLLLAVLTGLWLLWFFVERFGWVFSGLVVPGYLAAVFIVQPIAGWAIVIEGLVTFAIARLLSDAFARSGAWNRFFGRERFLLILVLSVVVRQHFELWVFPEAVALLNAQFGLDMAYEQQLYGVGLVLVPLFANMFWKLSPLRGAVQVGVPTALTYVILVGLILPFTNYGLSSLELTYEAVAVNFLGSGKIYVILLFTAAIAAAVNVYAGWDYGGILVPSLLAVAWFTPVKVATTLFEALALYGLTALVVSRWPLRRLNLEGPRKIVLVFTLGFGLKAVVASAIGDRFPGLEVTDLFGFGYLMPSLIAIKMIKVRSIGRVLSPTLAVSLLGVVGGSVLALAAELAAPSPPPARAPEVTDTRPSMANPVWSDPLTVAFAARLRAHTGKGGAAFEPARQERVANLWRMVDRWLVDGAVQPPEALIERGARLGLQLDELVLTTPGRVAWVLTESQLDRAGRARLPMALLHPGRPGPYLWVPRPNRDAPVAEAAVDWCAALDCRAVIFAGVEATGAAARRHRSIIRALSSTGIIEIHRDEQTEPSQPIMHLYGAAPPDVPLGVLGTQPSWEPPPSRLRSSTADAGRAVLRVAPQDLWRAVAPRGAVSVLGAESIDAWLSERLKLDRLPRTPLAPPGLFEQRVMARILGQGIIEGAPPDFPNDRQWVGWLDRVAALLGHRVVTSVDPITGRRCRVMLGRGDEPGRLMLVAAEDGRARALQVPRPMRQPGTWRFALDWWRSLDGRAIMIALPRRAPNGTIESAPIGPDSLFEASNVAMHAVMSRSADGVVSQVQGYGAWRSLDDNAIVALEMPLFESVQVPDPVQSLLDTEPLASLEPKVRLYRSPSARGEAPAGLLERRPQAELIGLVKAPNAQRDHARRITGARFVRVWLSEAVRADYVERRMRTLHPRLSTALGPVDNRPGFDALARPALGPPPAVASARFAADFEGVVEEAVAFARNGNPHLLRGLLAEARRDDTLTVSRGFSVAEGRTWLRLEMRRPVDPDDRSAGLEVRRAVIYLDARSDRVWSGEGGAATPSNLRAYAYGLVHGGVEGGR